MALPRINSVPKYEMTVPSSGQKVMFRPFLVKEEKVLMMAMETGDDEGGIRAIVDTITSCVADDLNVNELKSYDIEYLFLRIRAKSVGEKSTVSIQCSNCKHPNAHVINLEELEITTGKDSAELKITEEITVSMKFPNYKDLLLGGINKEELNNVEVIFKLIGKCIEGVKTEDEYFDLKDESEEEVKEFLESLNQEQFGMIRGFVESMPKLSHTAIFDCEECSTTNTHELSGIQSFFS
tara:strand:+ start:7292 stop:8005 length:714 start_codon:yes stop_codon:yes gene_type:complete